ncbi:MAG: hypothetical protein NT011_01430 [Kiritimatiellaeota bacterium]|nr:hypothetical protein [Kiritimatiellota bacterium]
MKSEKEKRLLIVTQNRYVSTLLFHGYGLPPWYDLPIIQADPSFRKTLTAKVNKLISRARRSGFTACDIHESFPIDLMRLDQDGLVIRGIDRFLTERNYAGFALLPVAFRGLKPQPRLGLLKKMTLAKREIDETDIVVAVLHGKGIPLVYSETNGRDYIGRQKSRFVSDLVSREKLDRRLSFPGEFAVCFDRTVPLNDVVHYPGVARVGQNCFYSRVENPDKLLEFYKYAGILMQASRKY